MKTRVGIRAAIALAGVCLSASPAAAQAWTPREPWSGRPADRTNAAQRLLAAHNRERRAIGVPPLRWSPFLADHARLWALELARTGSFRHSPPAMRKGEGENLFMGTTGAYRYEEMIGYFIGEARDFRPGRFPQVSRTGKWQDVGHYTQLIWPTTTEVGCAIATGRGQEYLVCRYAPPGNVVGERVP